MSVHIRNAIILAVKLEVRCPFCQHPQLTREGQSVWEPEDARQAAGLDRNCAVCGEKFILTYANRVNVIK